MSEWRSIPGWEGQYEVSSEGRVRNVPRLITQGRGSRFLNRVEIYQHKSMPNRVPYMQVTLWRGQKGFTRKVHILVLSGFVGSRPHEHYGCHINGDSLDNRLENLRWDTPRGNAADRERHGRTASGERVGTAKLTLENVRAIKGSRLSAKQLAKEFGVSDFAIGAVRKGITWKSLPPN